MTRDLSSAILKLQRAKVHIREAEAILNGLVQSNLCTVSHEIVGRGKYIIRIASLIQPPVEFSLAIGDAAHCLRSALDHISFAFAKEPSPGKENRKVQFPICLNRINFINQRNTRLTHVDRSARSRIERFQPYHNRKYPDSKWLSTVREIDDLDKHRLLAFTEVFVKRVTISVDGNRTISGFKGYKGCMEVGAILARFKTNQGTSQDKIKLNVVVIPVFGKNMPEELVGLSAINCLINARNFIVTKVLPAFKSLN